MIASRQTQRGAVTLVGALFIVVVLSVMAVALLRMASSNILDSAMHNDAVEALFVAETGVEHASFLYASTSSCIGLAGVGPVNTGRGSFTLTNAALQPGGECRVLVTASVGSTLNAAPAVRAASADLRLALPGKAWAIGKNGKLFLWDGATWTLSTFSATENLKAITCPTTSECWAVGKGKKDNYIFAQRPGSLNTWQEPPVASSSKKPDLESVFCVSSTDCFAVGKKGNVLHWNGGTWSDASSGIIGNTALEGVAFIGGSTGGTVSLVRWEEIIGN